MVVTFMLRGNVPALHAPVAWRGKECGSESDFGRVFGRVWTLAAATRLARQQSNPVMRTGYYYYHILIAYRMS